MTGQTSYSESIWKTATPNEGELIISRETSNVRANFAAGASAPDRTVRNELILLVLPPSQCAGIAQRLEGDAEPANISQNQATGDGAKDSIPVTCQQVARRRRRLADRKKPEQEGGILRFVDAALRRKAGISLRL